MTALLAIETSGAVGSVALLTDGAIRERTIATAREQTERVLPLIEELLAEADLPIGALDAVVFGRGPGSFTGLRIAAAVAQGLALAASLPVIGVSSLAAAAQRVWAEAAVERSLVLIDAHMGEVYWGVFEVVEGLARGVGPERIGRPETVVAPSGVPWTAVGAGFAAHAAALEDLRAAAAGAMLDAPARARDLLPQALADWSAGRVLRAAQALPAYLRDETAWRGSEP